MFKIKKFYQCIVIELIKNDKEGDEIKLYRKVSQIV
jgi:hypothetical protein